MLQAIKRCDVSRKAFTLIELLMVMAIIGILASLMMVGAAKARKKAKITRAQVETRDLAKAWKAYWIIYGQWPAICVGEQSMDGTIIKILMGEEDTYNKRKLRFMDINDPKVLDDGMKDPWGNLYKVSFSDVTVHDSEMYEASVSFPNRYRYDY